MSKKTTEKESKEPIVMNGMTLNIDGKLHFNIDRLKALLSTERHICSLITDDNQTILCEVWTDEDNMVNLFPFAKLLTEEEIADLKMDGQTPEF